MIKIRNFVFSVFFLAIISFPAFSLSVERDDPARDTLPPSILPIVILQGSDYEMGSQYGAQAAAYIETTRVAKWASALQDFSRADVERALQANQHYIQKFTPEWIDFMRGMADGATAAGYPLTYQDVLLMNCTLPRPDTSLFPEGAERESLPPKRCSVCSAWGSATRDGRLIGVDTLDSPEMMTAVVIAAFPDRGNAYLCGADAGEIGDHFLMNNRGFFLGNSGGGGSPRDEDNDYGLCWSCSLPYLVRFSNTALEARDRIQKWHINIPENFHFVDVHGNAFVVEKTAALQCVRRPGDFQERDFLFSTNNYLCETMRVTKTGDFVGGHGGYGAYAAPRNKMIWDLLHNYHGLIDLNFAKMILRFPGEAPPFPPEGGWDAMFCRPSNLWTAVVQPQDGDEGIAHICTGPVGRVLHASLASDGTVMRPTYHYAEGTNTFYRLRLASDPDALSAASLSAAEEDIAAAYGKLMSLNFRDAGYTGLRALYGEAVRESQMARNRFNQARVAQGNQALALFARSVSLSTRAQAHALQVVEALMPPATSPSDLGLKPFGGDWATWETRVSQKR